MHSPIPTKAHEQRPKSADSRARNPIFLFSFVICLEKKKWCQITFLPPPKQSHLIFLELAAMTWASPKGRKRKVWHSPYDALHHVLANFLRNSTTYQELNSQAHALSFTSNSQVNHRKTAKEVTDNTECTSMQGSPCLCTARER